MEYAQKNISPVLARILSQMQQTQQFQPQSYGALAAGLGAQGLNALALNNVMKQEQTQRAAQQQALVRAISEFQPRAQGGPANIPLETLEGGTENLQQNMMPDPQGARDRLLASLIGNEHPMAQAGAGALFQQMLTPPAGAEPFTLGPEDTRFDPSGRPVARGMGKTGPKYRPATQEDLSQYPGLQLPEGFGAQINESTNELELIGQKGQTINVSALFPPAVTEGTQERLIGATAYMRALNQMDEANDFATLPIEGAIRGQIARTTGVGEKAQQYMTAYEAARAQQQAIIKGIPSNFDVRIFQEMLPAPHLSQEARSARINFQKTLTKDLVRMTVAFHKGTRTPIPPTITEFANELGIDVGAIQGDPNVRGYTDVLEMDGKRYVRLSSGSFMELPE